MPRRKQPDDFDARIEAERQRQEAEQKAKEERELQSYANAIGLGDNLKLAAHIRFLQGWITQLDEALAYLREEVRSKK